MQIQTTRFGAVAVEQSDLITLPEGLIGFNDLKKFVILEDPDDLIFAWLQSCERPAIAFPILEPELFSSDYRVRLTRSDREALALAPGVAVADQAGASEFRTFTIVTIPQDVTLMTANLKAPVVLNVAKRLGKQIVTQDNDHPIKHPIFSELQKRLVAGTSASLPGVHSPSTTSAGAPKGISVRLKKSTTIPETEI